MEEIIQDAEVVFNSPAIPEVGIDEVIGDVSAYAPKEITEPVYKEPIGDFDAVIDSTSISTGETNGRKWASVNLTFAINDMDIRPSKLYGTYWLGKEPPKYPEGCEQTQTEIFLDTVHTAGLKFDSANFNASVEGLKNQQCRVHGQWKKKKNKETGNLDGVITKAGYKKFEGRLIAPNTLPEDSPF